MTNGAAILSFKTKEQARNALEKLNNHKLD
jgi:hypothetical protein